ncbi:glycoside hydrolase family 68 protein [Streptosporangium sp. 'caverna']|uniref:glycoside hydrolase family 68 protein n=1 Tax=Streptosporangium sp. 'caverna' TaxID=2202249 RepID=UPI000D7D9324|nr:glycoside hydrolase family 68 protein [Streptosporangium sp. 'caverna']AWS43764.1 glycoside hydrolase 68 family protein [Streptosporangium sp. 'caverna']
MTTSPTVPHGLRPVAWTRAHLDRLAHSATTTAPVIRGPLPRVLPADDIWDMWPVQDEDGSACLIHGRELWMGLSAPAVGHPEERHDVARIRLLATGDDGWTDLGHVFADGASLGSREWSGSAVRRSDGTISVFYTASGLRGEARPTFVQRIIEVRPKLITNDGGAVIEGSAEHREIVRSDGRTYLIADEIEGGPGRIRAFRDPGWFRDPADGREYLLIAASTAWDDRYTGAVALAGADAGGWSLRAPLLVADGVNHEIERPHVIVHDSSYYLFFCTQRHSFEPSDSAPTGLYGFVAPSLTGPYEPLNGSGLVIRNPPEQPDQAYAWLVLNDLRVASFLNYRGRPGTGAWPAEASAARAAFGGTLAPMLTLTLDSATSSLT